MLKQVLIASCLSSVFIIGCQENVSVHPVNKIKHDVIETNKSSEENETVNTAAASDENHVVVIAYYFHRTMRCPACLAIETDAQRVIETAFEDQIADEKLMWIPINLDEPGSDEFEKEFDIFVSTLVLAKMRDGNRTDYKKLEKVWDTIVNPAKFDHYVVSEVRRFLNE